MDELFARWLQLHEQRKQLDPASPQHESVHEQIYLIEDELHGDYGKLLYWNRDKQCWQLIDAK